MLLLETFNVTRKYSVIVLLYFILTMSFLNAIFSAKIKKK